MLIVMENHASEVQIEAVVNKIEELGFAARPIPGSNRTAIGIIGNQGYVEDAQFLSLDGVRQIIHVTRPYKLASREFHPENSIVHINRTSIGGGEFATIAGPCAVENREQILDVSKFLSGLGVNLLRGGAFKPRTSPYSFQGLELEGLKLLAEARQATGMAVVTEAIDIVSIDLVVEYADVIQIGARNMQNFPLLKKAGKSGKPVLLKRGMSATLDELLLSAEYILNEGNGNVILCERGVRTFDTHSRNTLDLAAVPVLKELTHLPVLVDPSHASGNRKMVPMLSRAAMAVGADGIIVEIHPDPQKALSDGPQSLTYEGFENMMKDLQKLNTALKA